jgi:hypothetical protein
MQQLIDETVSKILADFPQEIHKNLMIFFQLIILK